MLSSCVNNGFEAVVTELLGVLHQRIGFDLWMLTRTQGDDWIILYAEDNGYAIPQKSVFSWGDTFCVQMCSGRGPSISPNVSDVDVYTSALIGEQLPIGAYAGVPIFTGNEKLFGTLCAIHPTPLPESIRDYLPLLTVISKLLGTAIDAQIEADVHARRAEKLEALLFQDGLTNLFNRRGWDKFIASEENRCARLGKAACVIIVDLDNLKQINDTQGHLIGDAYICRAARAIEDALAIEDAYVARIGGDEFAIVCSECNSEVGKELAQKIRGKLHQYSVKASVGIASRRPLQGLHRAWEEADQEMYRDKERRSCRWQEWQNKICSLHVPHSGEAGECNL